MDKNMIHIDDLIKQRLLGEEDERPGAWLHMRDLLDKNMPTNKVPAAFNWRRLMTYAGVILAIGAVGVGGYEASTSFRDNDGVAVGASSHNADGKLVAVNTAANNNSNVPGSEKSKTSQAPSNTSAKANIIKPNAAIVKSGTVAGSTITNKPETTTTGNTANSLETNNNRNNNFSSSTNTVAANETVAKVTDKANGLVTDKPAQEKAAVDKATGNKNLNKNTNINTNQQKTAGGNDLNNTQQPGINRKKDSIPMIALVERMHIDSRTRKVSFTMEQVASGKVALEHMVASEKTEAAVQVPAPVSAHAFIGPVQDETYAAALPKSSTSVIASNSGSKNLESRKERKGWNFSAVMDMLRDAKDRLKNMEVQHSQGFIGGINATFGTPAFYGFHLGLYENIRFNENWSMQVEGKYMQRFNGVTLQDNYTTYEKGADGKYTQNLVEHSFKYNSLSSFEIPLMVRYNTGDAKWNFFAGGSAIYNLAIKNEEISRTNPVATGLTFGQEPVNETPKVTLNDFAARLGVGYLVGVSYNITPKAQVDVRFTQSVWDNAQGAGQQKISNSLYRAPSAQISFGWRFGKDDKK